MRKIMLIPVFMIMANLAVAQGLQKGNLFGVHLVTVELKPNVKMDEFKAFFVNEVLPQYEKNWVGLKGYLVKSVRGDYKDRFFVVWLFESEKARDKYFNADGTPNDLEKAAFERVGPVEEKLKKFGTYTIKYTDDFVVQ
ncbi:MAG TPA: hypothetical protein VGQ59_09645 [Cyclobacteriaceae bacterium]|nr:hypothetical protein [Cyclobacteriaceae bacterium]